MSTSASIFNGGLQNPNAPGMRGLPNLGVINNPSAREVVRCAGCMLVQFRTQSDLCRRCDQPLPRPQQDQSSTAPHEPEEETMIASRPAEEENPPSHVIAYRGKTMTDFSLGPRLRELREFKNLTQAQIARKARVPRTYISRIEHCHLLPGLGVVQRLAEALSIEILDLIPNNHTGDCAPATDPYWSSFVQCFRQLHNEQQTAVLSRVRAMLCQRQMNVA